MIRLEVKDICHNCPNFEPEVDKLTLYGDDQVIVNETIIFCGNRELCNHIREYLNKKEKGE